MGSIKGNVIQTIAKVKLFAVKLKDLKGVKQGHSFHWSRIIPSELCYRVIHFPTCHLSIGK